MSSLVNHQVGPYTLCSQLGLGGTAEVWQAAHVADGRAYAVKILRPEVATDATQVKALEREFSILEQLRHRSLPPGRRWVEVMGRPGFVMDMIPGDNLATAHARRQAYNPVAVLRDIVEVIGFLHDNGLIHNDIKLENVILRPDGTIGLVDLGSVRRIEISNPITNFFRGKAKQIFGTATYLAPELIAGKRPTIATDIYALGVTAYLLLTGKPPFIAGTNDERLRANASEIPPTLASRLPGIPAAPASVIECCLAKKPELRPSSTAELLKAVDVLRAKVTTTKKP